MRKPVKGLKRTTSYDSGMRAEKLAALLLRLKGYRILSCRYRAGSGEIDIIAQRRRTIIFVEVKARVVLDEARVAISRDKERRIINAVRHWLARNPWAIPLTLRCDAVFIGRRALPQHVTNVMTLYLD